MTSIRTRRTYAATYAGANAASEFGVDLVDVATYTAARSGGPLVDLADVGLDDDLGREKTAWTWEPACVGGEFGWDTDMADQHIRSLGYRRTSEWRPNAPSESYDDGTSDLRPQKEPWTASGRNGWTADVERCG